MNRATFISTVVIAITLCAPGVSRGGGISDYLNASDVVVIATPNSFSVQPNSTTFNLLVISWLSTPPGGSPQSLSVVWTAPAMVRQVKAIGSPGIWFLKSLVDGSYAPVPLRQPTGLHDFYYDAPQRGACSLPFTYASNSAVTDKIALEIACFVASGAQIYQPRTVVDATVGLSGSPLVHGAFEYLSRQPDSQQQSLGIAALIAANETGAVELLERHLGQIADSDLALIIAPPLLNWRNQDQASVRSLGRIATSPRAQGHMLLSAALALREVHTSDALPYLSLLLDSSDQQVQVHAILGFVAFVTGLPIHTQTNTKNLAYIQASPTSYSADPSWKKFSVGPDSPMADIQAASAFWKGWLKSHPELPQSN